MDSYDWECKDTFKKDYSNSSAQLLITLTYAMSHLRSIASEMKSALVLWFVMKSQRIKQHSQYLNYKMERAEALHVCKWPKTNSHGFDTNIYVHYDLNKKMRNI